MHLVRQHPFIFLFCLSLWAIILPAVTLNLIFGQQKFHNFFFVKFHCLNISNSNKCDKFQLRIWNPISNIALLCNICLYSVWYCLLWFTKLLSGVYYFYYLFCILDFGLFLGERVQSRVKRLVVATSFLALTSRTVGIDLLAALVNW